MIEPADASPQWETTPETLVPPSEGISSAGKGRDRTSLVITAAIATGVLIIATILFFTLRGGQTLTVNFALMDFDDGVDCELGGTGGYSDVGAGMDVVIRDNSGEVIGTGALQEGGEQIDNSACVWTAVVEDLPSEDYYAVSVGRRGEQVYTADELAADDWTVNLTLGGA